MTGRPSQQEPKQRHRCLYFPLQHRLTSLSCLHYMVWVSPCSRTRRGDPCREAEPGGDRRYFLGESRRQRGDKGSFFMARLKGQRRIDCGHNSMARAPVSSSCHVQGRTRTWELATTGLPMHVAPECILSRQ